MNRRQLLLSASALAAIAIVPVTVAPAAPFVPPTTNIVHLAGRIGQSCSFTSNDVLQMLGLDPDAIKEVEREHSVCEDTYSHFYYDRIDQARSLAERGDHDIYDRARLMIEIKRKMNLHFNFRAYDQEYWLDKPNPRLQGLTFRQVMKQDLRFAAEIVDRALEA